MNVEDVKNNEDYIRYLRLNPIEYINKHIKVVHPIKGLVKLIVIFALVVMITHKNYVALLSPGTPILGLFY